MTLAAWISLLTGLASLVSIAVVGGRILERIDGFGHRIEKLEGHHETFQLEHAKLRETVAILTERTPALGVPALRR